VTPDHPLTLHPLVYLPEDDQVTIGRADIDAYIIVPADGAEVIRRLEQGRTPRQAADWYLSTYGEPLDVMDVVSALADSGFVRSADEPLTATAPVRWQRLGRIVFSRPAAALYLALTAWAVLATVNHPDLLPSYRHIFFSDYYSVIELVLFVAAVPQLLLHEAFHALAGRRLGLRSRLSIGRRLYFVVLETSMDGLVAVPRRRRYLPILAGLLADVIVVSALTVTADLTREADGRFGPAGRVALAFAFAVWLRILWQFTFYLRTDVYVLITTVLGCVDLQGVTNERIREQVDRRLRRDRPPVDRGRWHPADERASRWYAWLVVIGYTVSITTFVLAAVPIAVRMTLGVLERFTGREVSGAELLDSIVVTGFVALQLAVAAAVFVRERRRPEPHPQPRPEPRPEPRPDTTVGADRGPRPDADPGPRISRTEVEHHG
jgi:hypothetical protein